MRTLSPKTIADCDELLIRTHNRYLAAMDCEDLPLAAELWIQLHELLDVRITLPLPRQASR